jgi:uncharacterized protein (TIGR00369 family)
LFATVQTYQTGSKRRTLLKRPLPYSDWCYVCGKDNPLGLHIVFSADDERVRARYTPELHRQGYRGVTHGGVLSTVLDETMGWAPTLSTGRLYVTGELTVRYIEAFPVETTMIVEAWAERVTRRLAYVLGEVRDEEGTLYASARGKFLPMSEEETRTVEEQLVYDPDTWRVFKTGDGGDED